MSKSAWMERVTLQWMDNIVEREARLQNSVGWNADPSGYQCHLIQSETNT